MVKAIYQPLFFYCHLSKTKPLRHESLETRLLLPRFHGKKVLVVGNSASGLDIASQIRQVSQQPLLMSVQTATPPDALEHAGVEEVPQIEEFLVEEGGVRFVGGRVEKDIDAIVFCTGYLFNFPFLRSFKPPLLTTGRSVHGLYKHLIHIQHPSLAFFGLPMKVVPFPLVASQAAALSRLWSNRLPLPPREEMEEWHRKEVEEKGERIHVFPKGGDSEYVKAMNEWTLQAGSEGKDVYFWDEEQLWQRTIYAKMKFEKLGRDATFSQLVPNRQATRADKTIRIR